MKAGVCDGSEGETVGEEGLLRIGNTLIVVVAVVIVGRGRVLLDERDGPTRMDDVEFGFRFGFGFGGGELANRVVSITLPKDSFRGVGWASCWKPAPPLTLPLNPPPLCFGDLGPTTRKLAPRSADFERDD